MSRPFTRYNLAGRPPGVVQHRLQWRARVWCGGRYCYLGLYPLQTQAAQTAAKARVILRGQDRYGHYDGSAITTGQRIYVWRLARRLSRRALAELVGCTTRRLRRVETGEVRPSVDLLVALADALGLTLDQLAGR